MRTAHKTAKLFGWMRETHRVAEEHLAECFRDEWKRYKRNSALGATLRCNGQREHLRALVRGLRAHRRARLAAEQIDD